MNKANKNWDMQNAPVITFDGLSATGKGTIAKKVGDRLKFHYLDSGIIYREIAYICTTNTIDTIEAVFLEKLNKHKFGAISENLIRTEKISQYASKIATDENLRKILVDIQRKCARFPGLVADGRDMGSVIFPTANVKFFFEADIQTRTQRRYEQLLSKGFTANKREIMQAMVERDERDANRSASPTIKPIDSITIDTTSINIEQVLELVYDHLGRVFFSFF